MCFLRCRAHSRAFAGACGSKILPFSTALIAILLPILRLTLSSFSPTSRACTAFVRASGTKVHKISMKMLAFWLSIRRLTISHFPWISRASSFAGACGSKINHIPFGNPCELATHVEAHSKIVWCDFARIRAKSRDLAVRR